MIKYIELKSGYSDNGPAWVGRVNTSKSGSTIYFNCLALKKIKGGGISGNYLDLNTGNEYWVSGIKKIDSNRHWAGSGNIAIEKNAVEEYLAVTEQNELDCKLYTLCSNFPNTTGAQFEHIENEKL